MLSLPAQAVKGSVNQLLTSIERDRFPAEDFRLYRATGEALRVFEPWTGYFCLQTMKKGASRVVAQTSH